MLDIEFNIIFWFVLGAFTLGGAVMATIALANVTRLRNVHLSWKVGKLWGYPIYPTLFLFTALVAGLIAFRYGALEGMIISSVYGWFGFCWFLTSLVTTKRFITDYGIVKNVNESTQKVAWHQVRDFVVKERDQKSTYIFICAADKIDETHNLVRLELEVPHSKKESFEKLVSHKLGRRIRCYIDREINVRQFE